MLNIFDVGIILLLILFIILGIKKGVIKELVSLVGIIIVFILSWSLKGIIGNFLCIILPFFKFTGIIEGMSSLNILLYQAIAFIIVFSLLMGLYGLSLKLSRVIQKIVNMTIILWLPSKLLGGVVSFIKGYLVLFIVFVFLMIPLGKFSVFNESKTINYMLYETPVLSKYTNSFTEPIVNIFDLAEDVSKNKTSINDANVKAIGIILKYNICDEKTINKLIELNKLDNINGIEKIL